MNSHVQRWHWHCKQMRHAYSTMLLACYDYLESCVARQDAVHPCIRRLNRILRSSRRCFDALVQLHEDTAENIATAIRTACDALHQAGGALDANQQRLQADVRNAFKPVQVRALVLIGT